MAEESPQPSPADERRKAIKDSNPSGAIDADFKRREAVRLKLADCTYEDIAKELGCSKTSAFRYVNDGWALLIVETNEERLILRAIEEDKLDTMEKMLMPIVKAKNLVVKKVVGSKDGDEEVYEDGKELQFKAMDRLIKISKRRSELRGLDSPKQVELEIKKKSNIEPLSELRNRVFNDPVSRERYLANRQRLMSGVIPPIT